MAITFRSAATNQNGAAPSSLTITKPAGVVDGDAMVAFIVLSGDKNIDTYPTGWTRIDAEATGSTTADCRHACFFRIADTEGASYQWVFTGGADCAGAILAYQNVLDPPVNVEGFKRITTSTVTQVCPSVLPGSADTVTISAFGVNPFFDGDTTFTTPAGLTARAEADPGAGTTNRAVLKVFDVSTPTAVATGDQTSTLNNAGKGVTYTVTLSPSAAADTTLTVHPYRVVPTATGCMLGWYDDNSYSGANGLKAMESLLQTHFSVARIYCTPRPSVTDPSVWDWNPDQTSAPDLRTVLGDNRLALISHKPPKHDNAWIEITRGDYDSYIRQMVAYYKALAPTKIVVVFHHEPHGHSSDEGRKSPVYGTIADFKKAFRHIAKFFKDANADNVYMGYTAIDSDATNYPNDPGYPGDDMVDVLCHDTYNWGGYQPGPWRDPIDIFPDFVTIAKAVNKPIIFGEIGCHPDIGAHDRGQWLRDMAAYLKTGDAATYILGYCYYHVDNHVDSQHPNGTQRYFRFAQGPTADAAADFVEAFSQDAHFLDVPIAPSLQTTDDGGGGTGGGGGGTDDSGTPPSVEGVHWDRLSTAGGVQSPYGEISGLASSPKGGVWGIRDSENPATLNWLTQTSRGNFTVHDVPVTGAINGDWEDCFYSVEGGTAYVYIHDNRDGNGPGSHARRLYKVTEPANPGAAASAAIAATYYWFFPGTASSATCGGKQNCEAVFIFKGVIYAVQKTDADEAEVYRLGAPGSLSTVEANPTIGVKVGTIGHHCPSAFSVSADGTAAITVSHGLTKVWRGEGDTIDSLLTGRNTLVYTDSPGGNGEGADWFPYQSGDFLVVAEDRSTFDYNVDSGFITTSGIPSKTKFGTGTAATLDAGPITIFNAGAIFAPGDFDDGDPDAAFGLDFGTPTVAFTPPTPDVDQTYYFEPPFIDDVPPLPADCFPVPAIPYGTPVQRFFSHMKPRARGRTVILLKTGAAVVVDYPTQVVDQNEPFVEEGLAGYTYEEIARVFLGGHIGVVDSTEAGLLTVAGFASGLTPIPDPPQRELTWGALVSSTWDDFRERYGTWGG